MKSKTAAVLLALFMSLPACAQMVSQTTNINAWYPAPNSGQSFTATATAQITKISVRPQSALNGNLLIYNGSAGSGAIGAIGSPAYSQSGVSLAATTSTGPLRDIVLTTPFPVTAGNTYTFILQGTNDFFISPGNLYAGGGILLEYADPTYQSIYDFNFQVWAELPQTITFSSTVPAAAKVGDSYTVTATGGASGNPVVFSIDPSASAVCSIAGATVTLTGVGTCTINANQAGGNASGVDYLAAPQLQQSFAVAAAPVPTTRASIPTLSGWGLLALSSLLALFAVGRVRRNQA